MGYSVEKIDTSNAPETVLVELAQLCDVLDAEDLPDDPPTPIEARIQRWRHPLDHWREHHWIARDNGDLFAHGLVEYHRDQNLENAFFRIETHPASRRRGLASVLVVPIFEHLAEHGRGRIATWIKEGSEAEGFAAKLGLKRVYNEKRSRLTIADLDVELMSRWIERASERASDYDLLELEGPIPEEIIQRYCDLALVMNTAPREDMEEEDLVLTPKDWREIEAVTAASKKRLHTIIAVHRPTGEFAGYTTLMTQDLDPTIAWQWETGVDPAHRNQGLGRWIKAANILRVINSHPAVTRVDTYNAGSNEPMLSINIEMGFEVIQVDNHWQGPLGEAREALGV
jgi:GNAT superfamily N-acetyltransferase